MTREAAARRVAKIVRAQGGVVRSATLAEAGVAKRAVADAVDAGLLVRERRLWVAVPDADPDLRHAAREGVVLSCATAAQRAGLWVLDAHRLHVAAHPHAGMVRLPRATVHRAEPLVPRHPGSLVDPIENVLALVAACLPFEQALAIWDSALNKRLVDSETLRRLPLRASARAVLAEASPYRDSGLETLVPTRLRWMRLSIRSQVWLFGHRVDHLIGERLVLQIDGAHHVDAQRASDVQHDAELMLRGFHVIRIGYDDVVNRWPHVQDLIMRAVAQGLHLAA